MRKTIVGVVMMLMILAGALPVYVFAESVDPRLRIDADVADVEIEVKVRESEKSTKYVYGNTDVSEDTLDKYMTHCKSMGGVFNTCGSFCKEGEVCAKVCALTCEKISTDDKDQRFRFKDKKGEVEVDYKVDESRYMVKYEDGYEIQTELEVRRVRDGKLEVETSSGVVNVEVSPNDAAMRAFGREPKDVKIELRERKEGNVPAVVYKIDSEHQGRFLGIFKIRARYESEIDATSGKVLDWKGPWWAFMVSGKPSEPSKGSDIKVVDFETCLKATDASTDSIPSQCNYDGKVYVEDDSKIIGSGEEIKDFETCIAAGYPVMESYPRQCRFKESVFVEII